MSGQALFSRNNYTNGVDLFFDTNTFGIADLLNFPVGSQLVHEFSRDGSYFVTGGLRFQIEDKVFTQMAALFTSVAFSFSWDSAFYAVGATAQPRVRVYDTDTWTVLPTLPVTPNIAPRRMAFSPDGSHLAVTFLNATTNWFVYETETWTSIPLPTIAGNGYEAKFSPNMQYLGVVHSGAPRVSLFTFPDLQPVALLPPAGSWGTSCDWSPDGRYFAYTMQSSSANSLTVLDSHNGFQAVPDLPRPFGFSPSGIDCKFSPDGKYLAFTNSGLPNLVVYETESWGIRFARSGSGGSRDTLYGLAWSHTPIILKNSGQILDSMGQPAAGADVRLIDRTTPSSVFSVATDHQGLYDFSLVQVGGSLAEFNRVVHRRPNDPVSLNDLIDRVYFE